MIFLALCRPPKRLYIPCKLQLQTESVIIWWSLVKIPGCGLSKFENSITLVLGSYIYMVVTLYFIFVTTFIIKVIHALHKTT